MLPLFCRVPANFTFRPLRSAIRIYSADASFTTTANQNQQVSL